MSMDLVFKENLTVINIWSSIGNEKMFFKYNKKIRKFKTHCTPLIMESLRIVQSILQKLDRLIIIHYNTVFLSLSVNFGLKMWVQQ